MKFLPLMLIGVAVAACNPMPIDTSAVEQQRQDASARAAAEQTYCYECNNIASRRILFGKPGVIGYVVFLNQAGQPVQYLAVNGKCTSSGKRLDPTEAYTWLPYGGEKNNGAYGLISAVGEDGTYGQSDSYIYCFTTDGRYVQWSGDYLYSDKPFDLTIKPLVIQQGNKEQSQ